ncbi:carboxypeptidase-like regulatory domain-containing protein [Subsaximicrobium wynnwilliamsii]|nr:carboxypeptidase-like regulatory domain-containing protein [Subsaximicrobium wynnwilliamsii]
MKNLMSLNIKTACSEKFDHFTPTADGGFCGSCQKNVIDFTQMKSKDIAAHFENKSSHNTCGRFYGAQLAIHLQKRKQINVLAGIGMACLSIFSMLSSQAQESIKSLRSSQKAPTGKETSQFQNYISVKGNVSEGDTVLPGVNVVLEGTTKGTSTNFDGDFEFPDQLKVGDVLVFSYVGFASQKVIIENKDSASKIDLKIDMKMDSCIIMGKVAVKEVYKSVKD